MDGRGGLRYSVREMAEEAAITQAPAAPLDPLEAALVGPPAGEVVLSLVLRPHRSLGAARIRELALWSAVLFTAFAAQLALAGAWPAALWVAATGFGMAWALEISHRQRRGFELVRLGVRELEVFRVSPARRVRREVLPAAWTAVELTTDAAGRAHLFLRHRAHRIALGRLLPPDERPAVAAALREGLARLRGRSL
ncbi:MAG: hypothetical protein KatS3mg119_1098 [Rhodothalassiaceae bacterium]|nr:MAG: hypothetical protein KatS3mg119_1098 [Rhodothalassiaceae bacterium]